MKQILFVCAGNEFPKGAFQFLLSMQQQETVNVLGLFFSPIDYEGMVTATQLPIQAPYDRMVEREREIVATNKVLFAKQCEQNFIRYRIHDNEEQWDKHLLIKESRFADLILLSGELFYAEINLRQPNYFLHEALHAAECPIMVIPEDYSRCEHLFIAYDGSRESLFAMKQFSYLFPQYTDLPTEIVYVKEESDGDIPDIDHLRHYTRLHFGSISFARLNFKATRYFASWIGERQHVMLISGSYGRSPFSYLAKRSFAEQVVHEHKIPIFIAHA
jgi:hypothetical protein